MSFILLNEKSLNESLHLIRKERKIKHKYPIIKNSGTENIFICTKGIFTEKHWQLLDIIGTLIFHCYYLSERSSEKTRNNYNINLIDVNGDETLCPYSTINPNDHVPNRNSNVIKDFSSKNISLESFKILSENDSKIGSRECNLKDSFGNNLFGLPKRIIFKDLELRKIFGNLPILYQKNFPQLIDDLSSIRQCVSLDVKFFSKEENKYKTIRYSNKIPCGFFSINKIQKKDNPKRSSFFIYDLVFDTLIGYIFVHNILSGNFNLLNSSFYDMSEEAQIIYKTILRRWYSKKPMKLTKNQIISKFKTMPYSKNDQDNLIKNILIELKDNKFIEISDEDIKKIDDSFTINLKIF